MGRQPVLLPCVWAQQDGHLGAYQIRGGRMPTSRAQLWHRHLRRCRKEWVLLHELPAQDHGNQIGVQTLPSEPRSLEEPFGLAFRHIAEQHS